MARNVEKIGRANVAIDDTEAEETYRCVLSLGAPELRMAVFETYFKGGTMEQKARALGCSGKTLYNRLDRAYVELLGLFNDAAAGAPLPRPALDQKNNFKKPLRLLHGLRTFPATVA